MQIVVAASDAQWTELTNNRTGVEWIRVPDDAAFAAYPGADCFFNFLEKRTITGYANLNKPVVIDSVVQTLQELHTPPNVLRMNGWPGFMQRSVWELAGNADDRLRAVFNTLGIRIQAVSDEPGFIAARVIAMIVNEAYLALEEHVSTKEEINTAMKLGTNYPFGPFEWAVAIGTSNILNLLERLNRESNRYKPAAALVNEVKQQIT